MILSAIQFRVLFADSRDAFRLEHQREPLPEEAPALEHWQAGGQTVPWDWAPWRDWLDLAQRYTARGGRIARVRLVDDPPTSYQRWARSITKWHAQSGERITYLPMSEAGRLGIPDSNYWLFDNASLVRLDYRRDQFPRMTLVTDPAEIRRHQRWRTLAAEHAREPALT